MFVYERHPLPNRVPFHGYSKPKVCDIAWSEALRRARSLYVLSLSLIFYLLQALFHGFPHPLLEEMMTMTAAARKRLPPSGTVHVNMDVGRHLARAYGVGLSRGAR